MKRYIEDKEMPKRENDDETQEKSNGGCKWVKTDSECKDHFLVICINSEQKCKINKCGLPDF